MMIVVGCSGADGDYEVDDAMVMLLMIMMMMRSWQSRLKSAPT